MSDIRLPRHNPYSADGRATRGRRSAEDDGGDELRTWMVVCAAISLISGVLGWKIGSATMDTTERQGAVASTRPDSIAGAWPAVVTTPPFATANELASASLASAPPRRLPFTVLRGYNDQNQPAILIEGNGHRFVASGLTVYGDYLIQLERDQVIFTYLPSAVRQGVSLPAVAAQGRDMPKAAGAASYWSKYRAPSSSFQTPPRVPERAAAEEAERD